MVPPSAVRETLILILFGIILVPIAAKRAQDTRGYWQTFQQLQDLATAPSSSSSSSSSAYEHAPLVVLEQHDVLDSMAAQNETLSPPLVYAPGSAQQQPPQAETRTGGGGGRTIRFGSAKQTTTTATVAAAAGEALATVAPARILLQQQQQQQRRAARGEADEELPAAAKASDASSKGRWTLVWMGSAIAAVAVLMSLC